MSGVDIKTFREAATWLARFALEQRSTLSGPPSLERIRTLLKFLGNPEEALRVIHLAGTSGKGSTAHVISRLLEEMGMRVGLHVSPHMFDVRERMQINNRLIAEGQFIQTVAECVPIVERMARTPMGLPTYFELLIAVGYLVFAREKVDIAVIETGMGGRFDATNTIQREDKIAVITKIGFDHMKYLGNTLRKIAREKAGIIQPHNRVLSAHQHPVVRRVLEQIAEEQGSKCTFLHSEYIRRVRVTPRGTTFGFYGTGHAVSDLTTNLIGTHQAENVGLALSVVEEVCRRTGPSFDEQKIRAAVGSICIPGRFEVRTLRGRPFILDVAHNPQKIRSLLRTLHQLWPRTRPTFVLALGPSSEHAKILADIQKRAHSIVLADWCVRDSEYAFRFADPEMLQRVLQSQGFFDVSIVRDDPERALTTAFTQGDGPVVVTGYFHFVAAIERLLARTRMC